MLTLLTGATLSLFSVFSPQELFYTRAEAQVVEPVPVVASLERGREETLAEQSDRIALAWNIPTSTLSNLWHSESSGSTTVVNIGCDRGLVQINCAAHPEVTDAQAFDPEYALTYAAHAIASSTDDQFVVCNCYAFLKTKIKGTLVPRMDEIVPNGVPHMGAVAIFSYNDKTTGLPVKHVAYVESIDADGFEVAEANFGPCLLDSRRISWRDPHLRGFWTAPRQ